MFPIFRLSLNENCSCTLVDKKLYCGIVGGPTITWQLCLEARKNRFVILQPQYKLSANTVAVSQTRLKMDSINGKPFPL